MTHMNRRHFLTGSAATFAGGTGMLGLLNQNKAWAADTSGYRALVCVFLFGGLDHADTVFPFDEPSYDLLADVRDGLFDRYDSEDDEFSRDRDNLLPITPSNAADFGSRSFALSPQMPEMQALFQSGEMAIVGNVGPLIEPTDRASFDNETVQLPPRLFSHNDQQSTWMALGVEGSRLGWGGQFSDAALASDSTANSLFASISTRGNTVFLSGDTSQPFAASNNGGTEELEITERSFLLGGNSRFDNQRAAIEAFYNTSDFGSAGTMRRDFNRIVVGGIDNVRRFNEARDNLVPFSTVFPNSQLGTQLRTVAETIEARDALEVSRQVFFVGIGGFDTHSDQAARLPGLQIQISQAINAFRDAMVERGLWNDVTLFTASDFGRTTIDNGDGTDHGWGGHHFVLGGSVAGGRILGDIPTADVSSSNYTPTSGRLIPSVSVEQYAATLGSWFGLNDDELNAALPNLSRFQNANLGFV
ncbi:MAG: DUF1501 domain-containing protein [Pseudomonadota bacterium]